MSTCLTDARLQTVADGEGTASEIDHARTCDACGVRVAETRAAIRGFGRLMSELQVPDTLGPRVARATARAQLRRATNRGGATTLRRAQPAFAASRGWVFAGTAIAALLVGLVFVVMPSVDPTTRLNAAEILNRSLQTLTGDGVERLEYDLSMNIPGSVSAESGSYRIEQLIDHDSGRWRFARFGPDGTLLNGIAENPAGGTRDTLIRHDGHTFRFRFAVPPGEHLPLWNIQRRYAETMIRLVQASAAHVVNEVNAGDRSQYVVELRESPPLTPAVSAALFDLTRARVVVDAADFHIVEFTSEGTVMGEHLSIGYRLIERSVAASVVSASEFELPTDPAAIELQGDGTKHVPADVLSLLLGQLARARR